MKKLFFIISFFIALTAGFLSCDNEDSPIESPSTVKLQSNKRSFNEALIIAQNATNMLGDKQSRSSHRTINKDDAFAICSGSAQSRNSDTLLYIFNYDDSAGYAIVSASLNTEGLLAVAERGRLDSKEPSEIPGVNMFIDLAKSYVALSDTGKYTIGDKIGGGISTPTMQKEENETIYSCVVEPRLKINWGQDGFEGSLFSNRKAGCATIAILNAFTYLEKPTSIQLTKIDNSILEIDWQLIKSLPTSSSTGELWPDIDTPWIISNLCREIALRCGIDDWDDKNTYISLNNMYKTLKQILPSNVSALNSNYHGTTRGHLSGIEIVRGAYIDNNTKKEMGHVWVVDGTKYYEYIHRRYIKPDNLINWILTDEFKHTVDYQHINWGNRGLDNGYYSTGVFNQNCCDKLDYNGLSSIEPHNYSINLYHFYVTK